jgi:hypothetical protein
MTVPGTGGRHGQSRQAGQGTEEAEAAEKAGAEDLSRERSASPVAPFAWRMGIDDKRESAREADAPVSRFA